jgi:CRP-like cAMP-binding protein
VTNPNTIGPVERALWLRGVPPFTGLRARLLAALAQLMREDIVRAGRSVRPVGRVSRSVRFLMEGRVQVRGERGTQAVLEAPQVIGLTELLAARELRAGLVAETDVTMLTIAGGAFLDLLEEEFALVLQLRQALGQALAAAQAARHDWAPEPVLGVPAAPDPDLERFIDRMLALDAVPMLRAFGVAVLAALLRDEPARRLAAGETVFAAGDAAEHVIVIGDGTVAGAAPDGASFRAGPGTVLGDNEALTGLPHACTVRCETAVAVIALDRREIWDAAEDHFHVARALLSACARRLLRLADPPVARLAPPAPLPSLEVA